ncbi:uncharacterized protein LACBIDRAFT_330053 [Laccaria bicolor S238N-H82]|uniref:Predicted protein n=1 Tax=Laccaria bicolor (strain S238N-H82 / ATCC MYA-4686) TaxID=486041 RepID=B0DK45_LACBS|nr:uncharacterized protein LACBIDRAFT_330053 [Laccaria bicolor S238N-H82]EDR04878.1 predicted protein [Laccaria bicolor S238N-H82]|eukprot:XP_001884268.1 predicted protein [Laccaria bicolor S238N-H82]
MPGCRGPLRIFERYYKVSLEARRDVWSLRPGQWEKKTQRTLGGMRTEGRRRVVASQKMDGRCRFWKKKNSKPKGYFKSQDSGVSGTGLVDYRHVYWKECGI